MIYGGRIKYMMTRLKKKLSAGIILECKNTPNKIISRTNEPVTLSKCDPSSKLTQIKKRKLAALNASAIVITILLACLLAIKSSSHSDVMQICSNANVLRLHIIANSDSDEDQRVKLLVRDAVLEYERNSTDAAFVSTMNDAEEILLNNGDDLLKTVRNVLKQNNAPYDAQMIIGDFDFPDRIYGNQLYPEGNYRAVRILLGNAKGRNWWCVMFPPLCIVEAQEGEIDYDEPVRFDSLIVKAFNYIKIHLFGSQEN